MKLVVGILAVALTGFPVVCQENKELEKEKENEAKALVKEFESEFKKAKTTEEKIAALQKLATIKHKIVAQKLIYFLSADTQEVHIAAARILETYEKDPMVANALIDNVKNQKVQMKKDPRTGQMVPSETNPKVELIISAGKTKCKEIGRKLSAFYNDKDIDVAVAAVRASAMIKSKDTIDPLISLLENLEKIKEEEPKNAQQPPAGVPGVPQPGGVNPGTQKTTQQEALERRKKELLPEVQKALGEITGETYGDSKGWKTWWTNNRAKFKESE